jgi:hypothetical protein
MTLTDDALVTFAPGATDGGVNFTDQGYMPVTGLTLGGNPLKVPGGLDGVFLHYLGHGEQYANADGTATIKYTDLTYELVGYKGKVTFGHDSSGAAVVNGGLKQQVQIAHGSLLAVSPTNPESLLFGASGIDGTLKVSVQSGTSTTTVGSLSLTVHHDPTDVGFRFDNPAAPAQPTGLTLDHGSVAASYIPLAS